jgi:hypothetical protein
MLDAPVLIAVSLLYLGLLFAVAWWGDKRADQGRSLIANPTIYALSMAVYCTTWTFYGSVGRAAVSGIGFPAGLPRADAGDGARLVRAAEDDPHRQGQPHHLDRRLHFLALWQEPSARRAGDDHRRGRHRSLHRAAAQGRLEHRQPAAELPDIVMPHRSPTMPVAVDISFYIALILAAFTIVFGTRHLDATERHEGMVAAIALESGVKLVAFVAVGLFVTYGLYDGFGDIFEHVARSPSCAR